ncbi:MAG: hypothetical protein KDC53_06230 [Saprospiraceae bacterium]|nr:hypothetical protein [Saprospiraceae bacterium]
MQIVHYIPHARFKITVFRSGNRYIVKFDDTDHDLSLKFREGEVGNLHDVIASVDEELLGQVNEIFTNMSSLRTKRFQQGASEFPEII